MIKRYDESKKQRVERKNGADGFIELYSLIDGDRDLNNKGRLFSKITVAPHSGIAYHIHSGDSEIYYVLSGSAEYDDNGEKTIIKQGDVTFTPSGFGHSILNSSDEPFEMIALVLYS